MPTANHTHNNEAKLTRTVLIVNACLITTWLPDCILATYIFLNTSKIITVSAETKAHLKIWRNYLFFGTYANGFLNGLIYILRINRIKNFYKLKLSQIFRGAKKQTEEQNEETEIEVLNSSSVLSHQF